MNQLIQAATDAYQAQRTEALAHLDLLFNDATMIGEHSDLLTEVKKWTESLAQAEVVGSSSLRRKVQLNAIRPDL